MYNLPTETASAVDRMHLGRYVTLEGLRDMRLELRSLTMHPMGLLT